MQSTKLTRNHDGVSAEMLTRSLAEPCRILQLAFLKSPNLGHDAIELRVGLAIVPIVSVQRV